MTLPRMCPLTIYCDSAYNVIGAKWGCGPSLVIVELGNSARSTLRSRRLQVLSRACEVGVIFCVSQNGLATFISSTSMSDGSQTRTPQSVPFILNLPG